MTTKQQPETGVVVEKQQPTTTRGIRNIDRPGRPHPFGVQWREFDQDKNKMGRKTEFFEKEQERDKKARDLAAMKREGYTSTVTREEIASWTAFQAAITGYTWQEVVANHHAFITSASNKKAPAINLRKWIDDYLVEIAAMVKSNEMSRDSERHKESTLGKFKGVFGHVAVDKLDADEVKKWISSLSGNPSTFNSVRKILLACLNRAKDKRLILLNPLDSIEPKPVIIDNRKRLLTPQQTAKLFAFAKDHPTYSKVIALMALEAWLGIRFSSAYRIEKKDVNFEDRTVLLPAAKLKTGMRTGRTHLIDTKDKASRAGLENVWECLAIAPADAWELSPRAYLQLKSDCFTAAGVPHPRNCLRKSFCSYDLAAHANPGRTAYLLGHVDQTELWNDYKGNASASSGKLYQSITPRNAAKIAQSA